MHRISYLTTAVFVLFGAQAVQLDADGLDKLTVLADDKWLKGISKQGDVQCSVEDECIVGSGSGTCEVMVDHTVATARQLLLVSTDSGYDCDIEFNDTLKYFRAIRYTMPTSDVKITGHSGLSHWNLCWKQDTSGFGRHRLQGRGAADYCYYVGGICYLWASPCSGGCSSLNDFSTYSSFCPGGIRYATETEWTSAQPVLEANKADFYQKCAAGPLDPIFFHCDYVNAFVRVPDGLFNEQVVVCDALSTLSPTPSPTHSSASPIAAAGAGVSAAGAGMSAAGGVAAIGDPHLTNVYGQRFDLMRPGQYVLVNIPRGASAENTLLRVEADARRLGGACADLYFQEMNVTGAWVNAQYAGGLHFQAQNVLDKKPSWVTFGKVQIKVAHGHTQQGTLYLNFYVKHLGQAGFEVGGLLGEDDHLEAATPSKACSHQTSI
jgi:hypothetical protein